MSSSWGPMTAVSSGVAGLLPERFVARMVRTVYPRVEPELARLTEFVRPGGTAVDVGAWYGPWTRRLRRIADTVVAVEPTEEMARCIATAFADVRVVRAAASDELGTAQLFVPDGGPAVGISSLHGEGRSFPVPRVTLDGLKLDDVRFIKIDVEGHELQVLRGATETIRRDGPALLVEVEERIQSAAPIVDLLAGWGYRGWVLPGRQWVPLADFDLAAHQRAAIARTRQSLVRRVVLPRPRYVNSVLFRRDQP